jgi:hypothetical protein
MPDDLLSLYTALRHLPALEALTDAEIIRIAEAGQVVFLSKGENLAIPDNLQAPFYMVISGRVLQEISQSRREPQEKRLKAGDFCGADYALFGFIVSQSITAQTPVDLLYLDSAVLTQLMTDIPGFRDGLRRVDYNSRLAQNKHFQWVGEDEIIHLIARKHSAYLWVALALPALVILLAVLLFVGSSLSNTASVQYAMEWIGLLVLFAGLVWAIWRGIDWGNDYYIITDQRVVWLESVIGLYDSRQEVPLAMVQSSTINTPLLGRILKYGNVIAQAYQGKVTFRYVAEPYQVKAILDKWQKMVSVRVQKQDTEAMEKVIRRKIDPPPETLPQAQPAPAPAQQPAQESTKQRRTLSGIFRSRMEDGDVITYRKHIYVLLTKTWLQLLLGIGVFFLFYWLVNAYMAGKVSPGVAVVSLIILLLSGIGVFLSWLYHYIDWRNDIYRITSDKLIDSMKKPLGDEVTKSAPLANIQSLDYTREGIIGILLNYGNVIVNVGTDKLTFVGVHDPARVQADIFNRMYLTQRKKQLAEAAKQWDQVSDWLAAYHRQAEDLRRTQNQDKTG